MSDDFNDNEGVVLVSFDLGKMEQQAVELDAELNSKRFSARSLDGVATVTITGRGQLLDLKITDQAIRGSHPQSIGPAVVEVVSAARLQASAESMTKLRAVLDKDQEWVPEDPQTAARHEPTHRRNPAPVSSGDGEVEASFEEIDFLSVPGEEKRSRW